ncbi:MAG TPA: hypothetical protein VNU97_16150 [Rhizomicrobium sp.]|jgi:hypothetical protein|nr:hypothetical protein [Rhizomicrobium sp.]
MILRAIFWIGLVSFLVPHEPDLGFGRPGGALSAVTSAVMPASIGSLISASGAGAARVQGACTAHQEACAGTLSILDGFQTLAIRSMDQVRADLAANRTKLH